MLNDYLLSPHIKNGVLSLKSLKENNYPLFLYVRDNIEYVLNETNYRVLNEFEPIRGIENLKSYLKYYYGDNINVTNVRADNSTIYNNICAIGNPEDVISDMGFYVEYSRKITMDELRKELDEISVDGLVGKLTKKLENKLYYEANKRGITTMQYLNELGYTPSYGGLEYIQRQRRWFDTERNIIQYERVTVSKELPKARKGTKGIVKEVILGENLSYLVELYDEKGNFTKERIFSRNELEISTMENKDYLENIHGKSFEELVEEVSDDKSRKNTGERQ